VKKNAKRWSKKGGASSSSGPPPAKKAKSAAVHMIITSDDLDDDSTEHPSKTALPRQMSKMLIVAAPADNVKAAAHLLQVGGQAQVYKRRPREAQGRHHC
jgi:hypothetical protein